MLGALGPSVVFRHLMGAKAAHSRIEINLPLIIDRHRTYRPHHCHPSLKEMKERGALLAGQALTIWSRLEVSGDALRRAEVRLLHDQKGEVEMARRGMDDVARDVFDEFRRRMLNENVIEVATPKSVSYHNSNAEFVCEILPRTHRCGSVSSKRTSMNSSKTIAAPQVLPCST